MKRIFYIFIGMVVTFSDSRESVNLSFDELLSIFIKHGTAQDFFLEKGRPVFPKDSLVERLKIENVYRLISPVYINKSRVITADTSNSCKAEWIFVHFGKWFRTSASLMNVGLVDQKLWITGSNNLPIYKQSIDSLKVSCRYFPPPHSREIKRGE